MLTMITTKSPSLIANFISFCIDCVFCRQLLQNSSKALELAMFGMLLAILMMATKQSLMMKSELFDPLEKATSANALQMSRLLAINSPC